MLTTAMWSSWIELNPRTAERLGVGQGDLVEIASQHGKLSAPVMLSPGIAPDMIAMPIGQGPPELRQICKRPRREPVLNPCVAHRAGNRVAGVGRYARQADAI